MTAPAPLTSAQAAGLSRADLYRIGICLDCRTEPHSPGRPRCDACHELYQAALTCGDDPATPRERNPAA